MLEATLTGGQIAARLVLQVVLILINAFLAGAELAVMQLNPARLRRMEEEGDKAAPRMLKMVENSSGFLSTIQIGITMAGFLASAFAADGFAAPLTNAMYNAGFRPLSWNAMNNIVIILITIILAYFTLVFGELVPKQLALHHPYKVARFTTGAIAGMAVVMRPAVKLLSVSTRGLLRLFGIQGDREENVTEDEIRMMVDVGHETGNIDAEEKEMIDNVFELDNTLARDVMTHRVDVVSIEADEEQDEVVRIIDESGMSRFPVYDDDYDDILGILNARTYLLNLREETPKPLRELLRPARFVPETVPSDTLLRDMQKSKDHLAIVVDEYGGFSGVVTMEDIIEEIVGNIYDEFDAPEPEEIFKLDENKWHIAGDVDIEDIEKELGIKLPEDREYDSLGGLVFSQLSSIPNDGETIVVDAEGLHIETEPVEDHHIQWAFVSINPPPEEETEDEEVKEEKEGRRRLIDREREKEKAEEKE